MDSSVHDHVVLSYRVLSEAREIVLETAEPDLEPNERTDIVFSGVVAYHFEHDSLSTVLFDVFEEPFEAVHAKYADPFARGRAHGWPVLSCDSPDGLASEFRRRGLRAYTVSSSYGMRGFVLAERMVRVLRTIDAPDEPA